MNEKPANSDVGFLTLSGETCEHSASDVAEAPSSKVRAPAREEEAAPGPPPRSWLSHAMRLSLTSLSGLLMVLAIVILTDDYTPTKPIQRIQKEEIDAPISISDRSLVILPVGFRVEGDPGPPNQRPSALISLTDGSRLALIPGGSFQRGHLPETELHPEDDDEPPHDVRLPSFYMQETEVTNGQMARYFDEADPDGQSAESLEWRKSVGRLLKIGVKEGEAERHPATRVSHRLAVKYARWMKGILPTDAHWEYAARSGGQNRVQVWNGSNPPSPSLANIDTKGSLIAPDGVGALLTMPVKMLSHDRSDQGIYDLTGNVREWCRERWSPYETNTGKRKTGEVPLYSVRGGAYNTSRSAFRTTTHSGKEPADQVAFNLGFRVIVECH